nr:hypothetical protein [Rhizobium sp. BK181]
MRVSSGRSPCRSDVGDHDLVDELCNVSPEFTALWQENDVIAHGEGTKRLKHPILGDIELNIPGLPWMVGPIYLVVYNPVGPRVAERIRMLVVSSDCSLDTPDVPMTGVPFSGKPEL